MNGNFAGTVLLALCAALLFSSFTYAAQNDLVFNASNSGVIDFNTASQLKIRLTNDGNVGIGTSTPQNMLNVIGDANIYQGALTQYPPTPKVISSIDNDTNLYRATSVFVSGKYAYVTNNDNSTRANFAIVDISNPYSPQITSVILNDTNLLDSASVFVSGKYAYVTGGGTTAGKSNFAIVDVSNPYSPQVISSIDNDTNLSNTRGLFVAGKYAYVVDSNNLAGYSNFAVIDISNPYNPQVISSIDNDTNLVSSRSIFVSGKYAYVTNYNSTAGISNFAIIDISNPYNPQVISSIDDDDLLYGAFSIYVSGRYAYVANYDTGASNSNFAVIDVSNPYTPQVIGTINNDVNLYKSNSVFVSGKYAYVTNYDLAAGLSNFAIIDISDPYGPQVISSIDNDTNLYYPYSVFVSGKYAYVANYDTGAGRSNFAIIDLGASDLQSINTGSIQTGGLQVTESAIVNGVLTANQSITAGLGGIYSQGPLSVVDSNSSVLTSIFTVGKDANVGIGTTTATNKLTIIGDLNAVTSAGTTALYTNASSDGNVGIGTTNPLAKLHIRYADEIGGSYAFRVDNDTATGPRSAFNLTYYKDGNLGINLLNTLPYNGYVLDVNGSAYIKGIPLANDINVVGNLVAIGSIYSTTATGIIGGASTYYRIYGGTTAVSTMAADYSAANLLVSGDRWTQASSGNHPIIATAAILKPQVLGAAATTGNTAALYIEGAGSTTVTGGNWAVWVDNGKSRFDGNVLIQADGTPIGALAVLGPGDGWEENPPYNGPSFTIAFDGNVGIGIPGLGSNKPSRNLDVNSVMKLQPTDSPGQCAATDKGSIYYDVSLSEICTCNGANWVKLSDNSTTC